MCAQLLIYLNRQQEVHTRTQVIIIIFKVGGGKHNVCSLATCGNCCRILGHVEGYAHELCGRMRVWGVGRERELTKLVHKEIQLFIHTRTYV